MNIPQKQVLYQKEVGRSGHNRVYEIRTIGGLCMVIVAKGNEFTTAGVAPHRAIARHIAKKKHPDIVFTEIEKSSELDISEFRDLLPKYEEMTDMCIESLSNAANAKK